MGLSETDIEHIREAEFPVTKECAYLNNAASTPLPRRTAAALEGYIAVRRRPNALYQAGTPDYDIGPLRRDAARLLGCNPAEIGFVPSTGDGLGLIANGIGWQSGDNLVIRENEFPTIQYAAMNLARRGVEVRIAVPQNEEDDVAAFLRCMDSRTRAVLVSHVDWITGFRCDLHSLGKYCRGKQVLLIVDAIQSLPCCVVDVKAMNIDVLVAGTLKWLLGITGTALLYVANDTIDRIWPDRIGYLSVSTSVFERPALKLHDGAMRYLVGSPCEAALIALKASLELLLDVGPAAIQARTLSLTDYLVDRLTKARMAVTSSLIRQHRSAILSFTTGTPEGDSALVRRCLARNVIVSLRGGRIRVSPHFYNTTQDIDRLLEVIAEC